LLSSGELAKTQGIGKGSLAVIEEVLKTGKLKELDELNEKYPASLFELTTIRGLGPKKIKVLFKDLGISSVAELEYACQENRLIELKGFGEKTQKMILDRIAEMKFNSGKVLLPTALEEAEAVEEQLEKNKNVKEFYRVGALARLLEVQEKLEYLVVGKVDAGKIKASIPIEFHECKPGAVAEEKFRLTASEGFKKRWKGKTPELPSELLDDAFDFSEKEKIDLVDTKQIRGIFHAHTTASDGANSLEEMVEGCIERGLEYFGVSDHSKSAFYARGLEDKRIDEQRKEIDKVREKFPNFTIFHGIESDILADGSLDYPDKVLKKFDFVIASVHGGMRMNREQMTARLVKALENPYTTWIGHLSGRLLLGRPGYDFDWEKLVRAAEKSGAGFELNANPYRLDVDWRLLPDLRRHKIPLGIFPDAHSVNGIDDLKYGVMMARKGGMSAKQISNTMNAKEMSAWLSTRKTS
jgi:DNA polymerase (family 10)